MEVMYMRRDLRKLGNRFFVWFARYAEAMLVSLQIWLYEHNVVYAFRDGNILTEILGWNGFPTVQYGCDWDGPESQTWIVVGHSLYSYYLYDEQGRRWVYPKWYAERYFCTTTSRLQPECEVETA